MSLDSTEVFPVETGDLTDVSLLFRLDDVVMVLEEAGESTLPVSAWSVSTVLLVSADWWLLIERLSFCFFLWLDEPSNGPRKRVLTLLIRWVKEDLCFELLMGLSGGVGRHPSCSAVDWSEPPTDYEPRGTLWSDEE